MDSPDFRISFPGLDAYMTGNSTVTLSHGTRPSAFTIEVGEVYSYFAQVARLSINMNGREIIGFPECAIDGIYRGSGGGGEIRYTLRILDRRWKWWKGGGRINGSYNIRKTQLAINPDEHTIPEKLGIIPETKKTPQDLVKLCLDALGEMNYDISQVPNRIDEKTAPEVIWDNIPPAEALDGILSTLSCRVVLTTDNRIKICRLGFGASLPPGAIKTEQSSIESAAVPDSLLFIAGATVWQGLLKLQAVGIDLTGEIKPIESLSYAPKEGWGMWSVDAPEHGVTYGKTLVERNKARSLAQSSVWKMYRIMGQPNGFLGPIPEYSGDANNLWQYRIRSKVLDTAISAEGTLSTLKPSVVGQWAQYQLSTFDSVVDNSRASNVVANSPFPEEFSIDEENGLVQFGRPMFMYDSSDNQVPASLFLYTSYHVKNSQSRILDRFSLEMSLPVNPSGTGAFPFIVNDVFRTVVVTHKHVKDDQYEVENTVVNNDELSAVSDFYLQAKRDELLPQTGNDREYDQFIDISPDGAIQQVTWQLSEGAALTRASMNTEHSIIVPRYQQRQITSQTQTINQKLKDLEKRNLG